MQNEIIPRPNTAARAKPFLKWAGGKSQLLAQIVARLPQGFKRYYEPFLGGGAVFFGLQPAKATLSDINSDLIDAYCAIRDDVEGVIAQLQAHRYAPDYFYALRATQTSDRELAWRAARLIYLNRTCFNGLYRVNARGQFNVPFGHYNNPLICNAQNLTLVHQTLQGVELRCQPVQAIARQARRGDLVYFDPPYAPVSATAKFVQYAAGGFNLQDQKALAKLFRKLAARGVHVVLSNSDTPVVRALFQGFRIDQVSARRSINRCGAGRGVVHEVIISAS